MSSQYLMYGSEYLHVLTTHIEPYSYSYKNHLKQQGIATLFNIHLPIVQIYNFNAFLLNLMRTTYDRQIDEDNLTDISIYTADKIRPEYIWGHYHPNTQHLTDYYSSNY